MHSLVVLCVAFITERAFLSIYRKILFGIGLEEDLVDSRLRMFFLRSLILCPHLLNIYNEQITTTTRDNMLDEIFPRLWYKKY